MLHKTTFKMDNKFSLEYFLKLVVQYLVKNVEDHQVNINFNFNFIRIQKVYTYIFKTIKFSTKYELIKNFEFDIFINLMITKNIK